MDPQLIALYESNRQSFLIAYTQNREHFNDALAYAYCYRVAPAFHQDIAFETYGFDPFDDIYFVKREFVLEVIEYVDQNSLEDQCEAIQFQKLESRFCRHENDRARLIYTLVYTRIDGRFDDEIWQAIEREAPIEARSLKATFSPEDIYFE